MNYVCKTKMEWSFFVPNLIELLVLVSCFVSICIFWCTTIQHTKQVHSVQLCFNFLWLFLCGNLTWRDNYEGKKIESKNGILLPKLFLLWEKIVLVIEKKFWNSRLKAKNLQNFWDLQFLGTEWFFNLLKRGFLISHKLEQLEFKLEKNIGI